MTCTRSAGIAQDPRGPTPLMASPPRKQYCLPARELPRHIKGCIVHDAKEQDSRKQYILPLEPAKDLRRTRVDFPPQHPYEKYRVNETRIFESMARLDPANMDRKSKNGIVFRAGDLRSTYDEELLEKSSDAGLRVENAYKKFYEKLLSKGGTLEELENAILYYFLACKITTEEAGDLVLEDE